VATWIKVLSIQGGVVEAQVCPQGCQLCGSTMLSFSLFPIDVAAHIPADTSVCLALEAGGSLCDRAGRAYRHCTIDNGKSRLILFNVASSLSDEIIDRKRVTDVHHINVARWISWRCNINPDGRQVVR
jgi:hypothetical protein